MSNGTPKLESIFAAAVEIESADERAAFLDKACRNNDELRMQVERLLASDENAGSFLEEPPVQWESEIASGESAEDRTALTGRSDKSSSASASHSVPNAFDHTIDMPRVVLRSPDTEDDSKVQRTNSPEIPADDGNSRYQLQGEIARGGMGAIIKSRDPQLGRNIAIKVLLEEHKDKPEVIQRFLEEAQIGGQLQHPGIVPIYDVGKFADQRPYFSMKLVKGKTLAKLLSDRGKPTEDTGKFIGIFEQICQTMAYAHSRGVIHRDLKPANIMIGAFGQVQVMDWGLAKVLQAGGVADEKKERETQHDRSIIQTLRSVGSDTPASVGSIGSETQMGSVIGTPAYMPPEQALGEIDRLDERSDVFGLGAILCQILTGKPPYVGENSTQIFRLAARGKLDACLERLEASGADQDLIEIAKSCLELEPEDRPRDAGVLAKQMAKYLDSVTSRLQEAALASARQETRLVEARKQGRLRLALTGSMMAIIILVGSGIWFFQSREAAHKLTATNEVRELLNQASVSANVAESSEPDLQDVHLERAIESAQMALARAQDEGLPDADLRRAIEDLAEYERRREQLSRDRTLVDRLERIRFKLPLNPNRSDLRQLASEFQSSFHDAGLDSTNLDADAISNLLAQSHSPQTLIAGLDHWAYCLLGPGPIERLTQTIAQGDWKSVSSAAREVTDWKPNRAPAWQDAARAMVFGDDIDDYHDLLETMLTKFGGPHPPRLQMNLVRAWALRPNEIDSERIPLRAIRGSVDPSLYGSIVALRLGDAQAAEAMANTGLERPHRNGKPLGLAIRSMARMEQGKLELAQADFDEAIESVAHVEKTRVMENVQLAIFLSEARTKLSGVLVTPMQEFERHWPPATNTKLDRAIADSKLRNDLWNALNSIDSSEHRRQVRASLEEEDTLALIELASAEPSQSSSTVTMIAHALRQAGENEALLDILKAALANQLDDAWLNYELALSFPSESLDERIAFLRTAAALRPKDLEIQWKLADALRHNQDLAGAVGVLRYMKSLAPVDVYVRGELILTLAERNDISAARDEWRSTKSDIRLNGILPLRSFSDGRSWRDSDADAYTGFADRFALHAIVIAALGEHDDHLDACLRIATQPHAIDDFSRQPSHRLLNVASCLLLPGTVEMMELDLVKLEANLNDVDIPQHCRPLALGTAGLLAYRQGDFERAETLARMGRSGSGIWSPIRFCMVVEALALQAEGNHKRAGYLIEAVQEEFREFEDDRESTMLRRRDSERFELLATRVLIREFERRAQETL